MRSPGLQGPLLAIIGVNPTVGQPYSGGFLASPVQPDGLCAQYDFNFHIFFFPPVARLLVFSQFRPLIEGAGVKGRDALPAGRVTSV